MKFITKMNAQDKFMTLEKLQGLQLDGYSLHLGEVKQLRLSSWKGFKLFLRNPHHLLSFSPVVKGIFSTGAKDGVKPWLDIEYWEELEFPEKNEGDKKFSLHHKNIQHQLFLYLSELNPPGGHLMLSYEGEQKVHEETRKSLNIGIPPVATSLGYLLFKAGFQYIKDWYLSEGGFEGPRKLWGEKAPDEEWVQIFQTRTGQQLKQFMEKKYSLEVKNLTRTARQRAEEILEMIKKDL